eukprot:Hpha_TRINITY_DN3089_c0_g1::TRINITY_DN3089_c0_g1_i1::g.138629::m.138629
MSVVVAVALASLTRIPDGACAPCDVVKTCDSADCKRPEVSKSLPSGPGLETGLSADDRHTFEHLIGQGLRRTAVADWGTRVFADRSAAFLKGVAPGGNYTAALEQAFVKSGASWGENAGYTGYVGPNLTAIAEALEKGNIRERWGLMYVMTKTHGITHYLRPLADEAAKTNSTAGLEKLGLNAEAVMRRRNFVASSEEECAKPGAPGGCLYLAMPDMIFDSFNSWVRFDFAVGTQWNGSRAYYPNCSLTGQQSNDPSIAPPLSDREVRLQCNGTGPCPLHWCQGAHVEYVVDAPIEGRPSYLARAKALNYRTVAGPSGTTSNALQIGLLLGLTHDELAALRLTMAAWMLPTNDHSLFEILLGGDPFLDDEFLTGFGVGDLGKLMPRDLDVGEGQAKLPKSAVWRAVAEEFKTPAGQAVCSRLSGDARSALHELDPTFC